MASVYNFNLDQGSDIEIPLIFKDSNQNPIDLTEYTARMQVKAYFASTTPVDTLTTENGRIDIKDNQVTLKFPHEVTENISPKTYVYDLEIISGESLVTRVLQGNFVINPRVTKCPQYK